MFAELRKANQRADEQYAYWRGVTDLLNAIDLDVKTAEMLSAGFIAKALPDPDDRRSTANLKLGFIKTVFGRLVDGTKAQK